MPRPTALPLAAAAAALAACGSYQPPARAATAPWPGPTPTAWRRSRSSPAATGSPPTSSRSRATPAGGPTRSATSAPRTSCSPARRCSPRSRPRGWTSGSPTTCRTARSAGGGSSTGAASSRLPRWANARAALDAYLRRHPTVGDAWLLPGEKDPNEPLVPTVAGRLLVKAERRAKLPKLERGRLHPYRRLFAVEGKALPDVDVAKAGGWRDTRSLKQAYQQPDPATVLRVVEAVGRPAAARRPRARRASARGAPATGRERGPGGGPAGHTLDTPLA